jgi:Leucine-rich repeat (LRR) protein
MSGIQILTELKELYLSYNGISKISNLPYPNKLEILELSHNCIKKVEDTCFDFCLGLQSLNLAANQLESVQFLMRMKEIRVGL